MERKEAIEVLKKYQYDPEVREALECLHPELKESEDERIRKGLIEHLKELKEQSVEGSHLKRPEHYDAWIAWIEKEPKDYNIIDPHFGKSIDKIEPKFKVGDWCIDNEDGVIFQIVKVLDNIYTYRTNEGKEYSCSHYSLENDCHLWTINDTKTGDVLDANGAPFIYKKHDKDYVYFYCGVNLAGEFTEASGTDIWNINNKVCPATKEQRDLLFKAMQESGYAFDFDKKELKKIGQKPTWWSREDEKHKNTIIRAIHGAGNIKPIEGELAEEWLNSFKDKALPQPKPSWSEEDKDMVDNIFKAIQHLLKENESWGFLEDCLDWLKSLRPQTIWKPSDEQLELLKDASARYEGLQSLYNDLKKLREE